MERRTESVCDDVRSAVIPFPDAQARAADCVREWRIVVERTLEHPRSVLVYGTRDGSAVVLKVLKYRDEEWRSGEVLLALAGSGAGRVYEHMPGAVLLERLQPGTSLVSVAEHDDDRATAILADVIGALHCRARIDGMPTVHDWGAAFDRFLDAGGDAIDRDVVVRARDDYLALCRSQSSVRLLHGDVHHENVVYDDSRGWVVIDPKGVIGEVEYEIGAALRNPHHFGTARLAAGMTRRIDVFANKLGLDRHRIVRWASSQAVLSELWEIEDRQTP
jgi:streptomycin 6-kinase